MKKVQIPSKIIRLAKTESTNNYASDLIKEGMAENGTVVISDRQIAGKGQRGNSWESEDLKNLTFSIIYNPSELEITDQFHISMAISNGIISGLEKHASLQIKWPNDIYFKNKKLGGILIENSIQHSFIDSSIIGIGININQEIFVSDAPNPISLKNICNDEFDLNEIFQEILSGIENQIQLLEENKIAEIENYYMDKLMGLNQWRNFKKEDIQFEGKIIGLGEFGFLKIENRNKDIEEFAFKEVEFMLD